MIDEERAIYQWQMWIDGLGEAGQRKLRQASVLVSRVGGVGGQVAYQLAAAGIGRLVLAHHGDIVPSDLNRQILMTHAALGTSRVASARRRLLELNPRLDIVTVNENIHDENAVGLVEQVDLVVDCAPRFTERFAMNRAAVQLGKPLVECAMYDLEAQLYTVLPGQTACVNCLYPEPPSHWRREFPVLGAVAAMVGSLGALEVIKIVTGLGEPLAGRLWTADLRDMTFRTMRLERRSDCPTCHHFSGIL